MDKDGILKLLANGERITLECKKAQSFVPQSLWETYSAFSNTNGGTILLGVDENVKGNGNRFSISGVENADKICKDLWNILNNKEKVNVNLLHDEDVQKVDVDGKRVVVIRVPRADYTVRPVYINNNLLRGTFKRNHEGDYHCTEQELRMMMRDSNEQGNDRMFLEYYTMDDIDMTSLERYRRLFKTNNPDHVWNSLDNQKFLTQLGGYMTSRKEMKEGLTMAGLLMFGKGLPIREYFDNLRMDYIDRSNIIGDERYSDRITYDGTWENNLFNFIQMVLPRLTKDLPHPFRMEGIVRTDDTPQHKAVREALTNAIIHSDFMINGLLKVEKFDDKIVITNPGMLKLPIEQIYMGGESKSRNQRMQAMLRMIGYGENLGSGFPLILTAWNEKHWATPQLIEQPELMQVKLTLYFESGNGNNVSNNVLKNVLKNVLNELSERQKSMLDYISANPTATWQHLSEVFNVSVKTIQRDFRMIKDAGVKLERRGGRANGYWELEK